MKLLLFLGVFVACVVAPVLRAQEAALSPAKAEPTATPAPHASIPPSTPPPKLIPDDLLALPKEAATPVVPAIPQLDEGFKPSPLSPAADEQQRHVQWRRLRNETQNDGDIRAALKRVEAARTDLEKRKLLGRYYDLLYAKMLARATPDMKGYLEKQKSDALAKLPQPRVRPESALPTASATPSPAITPTSSPSGIMDSGAPDR